MNSETRRYFEELYQDRLESAKILDKPSTHGVWTSVIDKYSDQAHFIYELLQNADDAGATSVTFELQYNQLVFRHNGNRHFSVSSVKDEDIDRQNGQLGDVNSIASIYNSNKYDKATIGKFGAGFKAVFQYTTTPHIYDPQFSFKIIKYFVPVLLDKDYPGRKTDETIFVFPFDLPEKPPRIAHEDILIKLKSLVFPQLFLQNVKYVAFTSSSESGQYSKLLQTSYHTGDITLEDITLRYKDLQTGKIKDDYLWLCSKYKGPRNQICVGFFHNREGRLMPRQLSAFCFFPTKEYTGLNFIIHAPFLLTDSRESIQAAAPHNTYLINELANVATQSIRSLRYRPKNERTGTRIVDSNIFDIIPYDSNHFTRMDNRERISFLPIYSAFIRLLKEYDVIPTEKGYTSCQKAYWPDTPQTTGIFTEAQLQLLVNDSNAHWIDLSSGYTNCRISNHVLYIYLTSTIGINTINEDLLIKRITDTFTAKQSNIWLLSFYKYILTNKKRVDSVRFLPIFRDSFGIATAAYIKDHESEQANLFLPADNITGFNTIHPDLASHKETLQLAKALDIEKPTLKDMIYHKILPLYEEDEISGFDIHFTYFYSYYLNCSISEKQDFIKLISDKSILYCHQYEQNDAGVLVKPSEAYLPFDGMDIVFQSEPKKPYVVDMDFYHSLNLAMPEHLKEFLLALGAKAGPILTTYILEAYKVYDGHTMVTYYAQKYAAPDTIWENGTRSIEWIVPTIPGIDRLLQKFAESADEKSSVFIWDTLVRIAEENKISAEAHSKNSFEHKLTGCYRYQYYQVREQIFQTKFLYNLRTLPWLKDSIGRFRCPTSMTISELSSIYNTHKNGVSPVETLLDFRSDEDLADDMLSIRQKEKMAIADYGEKTFGLTKEEMKEAMRQYAHDKQKRQNQIQTDNTSDSINRQPNDHEYEETPAPEIEAQEKSTENKRTSAPSTTFKRLMDDFKKAAYAPASQEEDNDKPEDLLGHITTVLTDNPEDETEEEYDEDEFTKPTTNYEQIYKRKEKKSFDALQQIATAEKLQEIASQTPKYTYKWFKTLLGLEIINSAQNEATRKTFSINFGKVSKEEGSTRTLLLEHPDRYIPQSMEDLADISMTLNGPGFEKTVAIEVVNVRSYTLRAKIKNIEQINDIDLLNVRQANIRVQNPVFLLEELRREFYELPLNDDDNLMEKLCRNIRFVFGPPGTGKTTYLAEKTIIPIMRRNGANRILVLTPTNKAADVITSRIIEKCHPQEWKEWLIRFGATGDDRIERSGAYRERDFNILSKEKCVVITTIARFPYDYFMPSNGKRTYLNELKWDYIIMDEASMIPLINMIYPLYKKQPKEFIIAGDPFQIEPITSDDHWKDENIYTMVHLRKFEEKPDLRPYSYPVELLLTQYRSIPTVGDIFSKFTYCGMLKHNRTESSQKPLNLDSCLNINTLNILKFPVSKYESIYRPKRLNKTSSYQIYSAIFTYEYVHYLTEKLAEHNPGKPFSIGVIAPYRTEADLIDKLCRNIKPAKGITVQVGTIHGFQGDECDIIIAVFNTPPSISESPDMFLNKQNIINVAISRARDYLFVIMPDARTEKIQNLQLINKLERLMRADESKIELTHTTEIESIMFGQKDYLEQNSFTTSHQSVNVYGLPERKYEIRSEDTAVDIQIHQNAIVSKQTKDSIAEIAEVLPKEENKSPETTYEVEIELSEESLSSISEKNEESKGTVQISTELALMPPETEIHESIPSIEAEQQDTLTEIEFYALPQKMNNCPYDQTNLETIRVSAWKNTTRKLRTLMMQKCPKCDRIYMHESTMLSVGISQYRAKQMPLDPEIQKNFPEVKKPVKQESTKKNLAKVFTADNKKISNVSPFKQNSVNSNQNPMNKKPNESKNKLEKLKKQKTIYDHRYGWIKNPLYEDPK